MARQSKLSAQEVAELDETKQRETRNSGLSLMDIRDRGYAYIRDYSGGSVTMHWNVHRPLKNGEARRVIPDGKVLFTKGDTEIVFDVEELNKSLRWA